MPKKNQVARKPEVICLRLSTEERKLLQEKARNHEMLEATYARTVIVDHLTNAELVELNAAVTNVSEALKGMQLYLQMKLAKVEGEVKSLRETVLRFMGQVVPNDDE